MTKQQEVDLRCRETRGVELHLHTPTSEGSNSELAVRNEVTAGSFLSVKHHEQPDRRSKSSPFSHSAVEKFLSRRTGHKHICCGKHRRCTHYNEMQAHDLCFSVHDNQFFIKPEISLMYNIPNPLSLLARVLS